MPTIRIDQSVPPAQSYRANRVKSLFNATDEQATRFTLNANLAVDLDGDWSIGVIVGPSGSGKSSIGRALWGGGAFYEPDGWPEDAPIVDAIAPGGDFDAVTGALSSAGLGDVPTWLRPYRVLSTGQRFRADLARVLAEQPPRVVLDEFTSVVDRQIARVGAGAFAKAWRRTRGKAVLLSRHHEILGGVERDGENARAPHRFRPGEERKREGEGRWSRPGTNVKTRVGGGDLWPFFKPHHYLDSGPMIGAKCYVAFVDGEPVAHLGMGTSSVAARNARGRRVWAVEARACRMVVLPEWQGAGVGMRFLNHVAQMQLEGHGVLPRRMTTVFHTSHPGLCAGLRRSPAWRQISGVLHGVNRKRSRDSLLDSGGVGVGYGGHLRAVQGFRYYGKVSG